MLTFTSEETEFAQGLIGGERKQIETLNESIVLMEPLRAAANSEESVYEKIKREALDRLDASLQAKAGGRKFGDSVDRTVRYLPEHPQNGGSDPAAWEIVLSNDDTVDFSHSVSFDSDPEILAAEALWTLFNGWVTGEYGTGARIAGLTEGISRANAEIAAIQARTVALRGLP